MIRISLSYNAHLKLMSCLSGKVDPELGTSFAERFYESLQKLGFSQVGVRGYDGYVGEIDKKHHSYCSPNKSIGSSSRTQNRRASERAVGFP